MMSASTQKDEAHASNLSPGIDRSRNSNEMTKEAVMRATVSGYTEALGSGDGALVLWGSLGVAFVTVAARWLSLYGQHNLGDRLGVVDFSFADSWATTITAVGALLGTILGTTGILPDDAAPLSNSAFAGLSLVFAMVATFAPLVFSAFQSADRPGGAQAPTYRGYVITFLIACVLTLWAAVGEIATIVLLLSEIQSGFLTGSATWLFLVMLVVSVVAIVVYAWIRIRAIVEVPIQLLAADPNAPLPRWRLL
jgi:hypothetical protein